MIDLSQKSKFLSYVLRHKPEAAKLTLDSQGWCSLSELFANTDITLDELEQIVSTDEKGRYSFNSDKSCVRANQGHSTSAVKLHFKVATPPAVLYHGTSVSSAPIICKEGLKPMKRHFVHLSSDLQTAKTVGDRRKGDLTVFTINTASMLADGFKFKLSENGVWLIEHVPAKYLMETKI